MNVQADDKEVEESSSHSMEVDANVEEADKENGNDDVDKEQEAKENSNDDIDKEQEADVEADAEAEDMHEEEPVVTRTWLGCAVNRPRRFLEELGAGTLGTFDTLTLAEKQYFLQLDEIRCFSMGLVGAGISGGFQDTHELHVMKYDQAMKYKDKESWAAAVREEHDQMKKYKVFEAVVEKNKFPKQAKILTSTWAMKKKLSGVYQARVTACGYEQPAVTNRLMVYTMMRTPRHLQL
jgi:hypothetical protein